MRCIVLFMRMSCCAQSCSSLLILKLVHYNTNVGNHQSGNLCSLSAAHMEGNQVSRCRGPGGEEVQLEDVQLMADLCPDVVILRHPHQ